MARSREGIKVIITSVRAALLHGPGDLRIEEVDEPVARPGEVVLAIGAAATCGTDVKSVLRGHSFARPVSGAARARVRGGPSKRSVKA